MNVFRWSEIEEWQPTIRSLMGDHLGESVFAEFRRNPPEFVVGDDLSWLDSIIMRVREADSVDSHETLTRKLEEYYDFVVGFHGCRPTSLDSFRQSGLRVCDPIELNRIAKEIFGNTPEVDGAIESLLSNESGTSYTHHNEGRLYFSLSLEELVRNCGHYLLYGSEYLQCIAARLRMEHKLREIGKATVIEALVPISLIPPPYRRDLAGTIIEEIFERELDSKNRRAAIGFGFPVRESIEPGNIVRFHHPTRIPNPLDHGRLDD